MQKRHDVFWGILFPVEAVVVGAVDDALVPLCELLGDLLQVIHGEPQFGE
ncbi:hypothetical protein [Leucobacter sp. W1038]